MRRFTSVWTLCVIAMAIAASAALTGCTSVTVDQGWDINYEPGAVSATLPGAGHSVTVFELADDRNEQAMVGGEYNAVGTIVERYQSARPVSQVVTDAIVTNLTAQGFEVVRSSGWTLDPSTLRSIVTDLVLGGKVKVFWVERQPTNYGGTYLGYLGANMTSSVNIHVVVADPSGKQVLWEGDLVASDTYRTENRYATGTLPEPEQMIETAFKKAIDQLSLNIDIQRALVLGSTPSQRVAAVQYRF